jgi:hypothetical protein
MVGELHARCEAAIESDWALASEWDDGSEGGVYGYTAVIAARECAAEEEIVWRWKAVAEMSQLGCGYDGRSLGRPCAWPANVAVAVAVAALLLLRSPQSAVRKRGKNDPQSPPKPPSEPRTPPPSLGLFPT